MNRKLGIVSLCVWFAALALVAAPVSGPLAIAVAVIVMLGSPISSILWIVAFRRWTGTAIGFLLAAVATVISLRIGFTAPDAQSVDSPLRTIASIVALDLILGIGTIALLWGIRRGAGWKLIALAPFLYFGVPLLMSGLQSPASMIEAVVTGSAETTAWNAAMCLGTWAALAGGAAILIEFLRLLARDRAPFGASWVGPAQPLGRGLPDLGPSTTPQNAVVAPPPNPHS